MAALQDFIRYGWRADLVNLQRLMGNVVLRVVLGDFKLFLTFLLIGGKGEDSLPLVINGFLQFLYLSLLLLHS